MIPALNILLLPKPKSGTREDVRGFTLVETALALFAISLGLLGIFGLVRHGLRNSGDTENETRCTLLADAVFETLKTETDALIKRGIRSPTGNLSGKISQRTRRLTARISARCPSCRT
jgi:Tfp pilus assembly protein PilV